MDCLLVILSYKFLGIQAHLFYAVVSIDLHVKADYCVNIDQQELQKVMLCDRLAFCCFYIENNYDINVILG